MIRHVITTALNVTVVVGPVIALVICVWAISLAGRKYYAAKAAVEAVEKAQADVSASIPVLADPQGFRP